uniref:DUF2827 family protein n=1 Tax=Burkholderia pseudomallei TaxID=28450 RepID=UPI00387B02C6
MFACDEFVGVQSEAVQQLFVVNEMHLKEHTVIRDFWDGVEVVRQHKATDEPRIDLPGFMALHAARPGW